MPKRPNSMNTPPKGGDQLPPSEPSSASSPQALLPAFSKITTTPKRSVSSKKFLPVLVLCGIGVLCVAFRPKTKSLLRIQEEPQQQKREGQQQTSHEKKKKKFQFFAAKDVTTTNTTTANTNGIPRGVIYELSPDFDLSFPLPKDFDQEANNKLCEFRKSGMPQESPKDPTKRTLPRPEYKDKIKYTTLGGSNYILQLQLFIDSLVRFGVARTDILILSLDITTTKYLLDQGVMVAPYYENRILTTKCAAAKNVTNIRCQVSLGKSHIWEQVLADGYAIFLFDADVFFYKHPYLSLRVENPNLDLYIQRDMLAETIAPNPMGPSNFGVMLAFPGSLLTRHMMHYVNDNIVQMSDQVSFNVWLGGMRGGLRQPTGMQGVCAGPQGILDYEHVGMDFFFNAMLTAADVHTKFHSNDPTLFHSTCAEGSHTKEFIAKCMFPWNDPAYYKHRKTVTTEHVLDANNAGEIDYTLRTLAKIAKATNRAVRVNMIANQTNIYNPRAPWAIINGEAFRQDGIDLVEPNYWTNAQTILGVTPEYVEQSPAMVFEDATQQSAIQKQFATASNADELVVRLPPYKLQEARTVTPQQLNVLASDYICKEAIRSPGGRSCLHLCNGGHF